MNYYKKIKINSKVKGFVLPFTLFICAIMLLISVGISTVLIKQIYFSTLSRESQVAYYAADNAVLCTQIIDGTYTEVNGLGIFPYDDLSVNYGLPRIDIQATLDYTNTHRQALGYPLLASSLGDMNDGIKCAQSLIFSELSNLSDFAVSPVRFERIDANGDPDYGRTSTFKMKMDLGDGAFRCAKVTVNKTSSYRQIIAQGYSRCDRPNGSIERAVVDTSITH